MVATAITAIVVHTLISQLKPQFNNTETKNSASSIPPTFSCELDTFLEKKKTTTTKTKNTSFLCHIVNLAARNKFTELLFSACAS